MDVLSETAAFTIAMMVMIIGLVGVILPVVPGLVLIWLGALGFAIAEKFASIDPLTFALITIMILIGVSADIWMTQLGARLGGASFRSQLMGVAGGIVGAVLFLFFGGISAGVGAIIGSIAGVFGAEWFRYRDWGRAVRSGAGWLLGWIASTLLQLTVGGLVIALFVWQAFRG